MLTQEEYVQRVLELKRQGWSLTEIAREVGYLAVTKPPAVGGKMAVAIGDASHTRRPLRERLAANSQVS